MFGLLKSCLAAAVAVAIGFGGAARGQVAIQGAGATFPQPIYLKWIEAYKKANPGVTVDYQGVGSGGGINAITGKTVQFGASDAPLTPAQEKAAGNNLLHLPTVAGPAVMIYNLEGVPSLTLNGDVIAGMYNRKIRAWNDPKVAALNPGVALPAAPVVVVHRSDGSGTTFIFTDYLTKVSKDWADNVGAATTVEWPAGIGGAKNDGVAASVKGTKGAIGYVELAFAEKNKLPFARVVNKDGKPVEANIASVNAAAANLKAWPDDLKVSINDATGAESYPIAGYSYLLVYKDLGYMKDKAKAQATVDFIRWCETDGQELAGELGYARLPKEAQSKVLEKLKAITFDGEPLK
jgi:phosphate transport system substrate-binding protein